jgi:hypothetical protein
MIFMLLFYVKFWDKPFCWWTYVIIKLCVILTMILYFYFELNHKVFV